MATKIAEPEINRANLEDWLTFIARTTKQGGGFICLELTEMDTSGKPAIKAGSRLEVNHVFYEVGPGNEEITGTLTAPAYNGNSYIYTNINTNNDSIGFKFSNTPPVWSAEKGGWYSGNDRAVAKFFFTNNQYNGKVILDSHNAMSMVNTKQTFSSPPTGVSAITRTAIGEWDHDLPPGIYRYSVKGGDSGAGGDGGDGGEGGAGQASKGPNGPSGEPGNGEEKTKGAAKNSVAVTGTFIWHGGKIRVKVGANGGKGGKGGKGGQGSANNNNGSTGSRGARGGPGGGGGGGIDSYIGAIIGHGAAPGMGGNNRVVVPLNSYKQVAAPGSIGAGAPGGIGEGNNTLPEDSSIDSGKLGIGGPGEPGIALGETTNGHAQAWRIG